MTDALTIADLDDEAGKVYAFGMDIEAFSDEALVDLREHIETTFEEAAWMLVNLPIEGSVEISEMDREEVLAAVEDHNVVGNLGEPPQDFGVGDDG